ncbi:MAG: hypothetical protein IKS96_07330 [Fibrobacter sp.]|nr:hypothetical protein [Fibrobacter sp.]MBR6449740.1 hypothetical protein [Fibrobacter sp.]
MAEVNTRQPVDTEATRALIAKIKKGDQDNADAIDTEVENRTDADAEIITSLEDETTARRLNDELLEQQIAEVAVQTDWNENDSQSLAYLKNHPLAISNLEIEALFI